MLKITKLFRKKTNTEYQVGDTVYLLAYPIRTFHFNDDTTKTEGLGQQVKLLKLKITRIEYYSGDDRPRYYTDRRTGLENGFGGYYGFDSWETIQKAIGRFVDDSYKEKSKKVGE